MNRRDFLKRIGLGTIIATVPIVSKSEEKESIKEYDFDDLFFSPYKGNKSLFYVKNDSLLADYIYSTGNIDKDYQSQYYSGTYTPVFGVYIEKKEKYILNDFKPIINWLKVRKFYKIIPFQGEPTEYGFYRSPMRMVFDKNNGFLKPEFYSKELY